MVCMGSEVGQGTEVCVLRQEVELSVQPDRLLVNETITHMQSPWVFVCVCVCVSFVPVYVG